MLVETVLAMLTVVCHFKKVLHRPWAAFQARLTFTLAAFNILVQWHGLKPDVKGSGLVLSHLTNDNPFSSHFHSWDRFFVEVSNDAVFFWIPALQRSLSSVLRQAQDRLRR